MDVIKAFITVLLLVNTALLAGQEFNYAHYDTKDGLAGSTVYDMCQDKDGFMWFATENGLSRFDGTNFKNFTVKDGLPDNEVLKLFADSKGRIWVGTFNKEVCYYLNGKIYNKTNDALIKQIHLHNFLSSLAENDAGEIALSDLSKTIVVIGSSPKPTITRYNFPHTVSVNTFFGCDKIKIMVGDAAFKTFFFENGKLEFFCSQEDLYGNKDSKSGMVYSSFSCDGSIKRLLQLKPNYINISSSQNHLTFCSTFDGAWSVDTAANKWDKHYLPGKKVSNTLLDIEKSLWFSTLGEGVYKLPSREIKTVGFPETNGTSNSEVFSIDKYQNNLMAGLNHGKVAWLNGTELKVVNYAVKDQNIPRPQSNRLSSVKVLADKSILMGFDQFLLREQGGKTTYNYIYPIKSVDQISSDSVIAGTSSYVLLLRLPGLQVIDTIWRERCTKVYYYAGKIYVGTLSGLYAVNKDKSHTYLGAMHPSLTRRITDIKGDAGGRLWVATADEGIVGLQNNRLIASIKDSNGLSSNICKTLFLQNNYLWAGTNKGLDKINLTDLRYPVISYSSSDGLPSDVINAVYVDDTMVYVGSPAGLTQFNEKRISSYSVCHLVMLLTTVSGKTIDNLGGTLSYKQNSIKFTYAGISQKSGGGITYYYRMKGLRDVWEQTTQTTLEYPSLPPGEYGFELYAQNKFGVKSETLSFNFSIRAPFWKAGWFYALLVLAAAVFTGLLVNWQNRKYNKRLQESSALQKQFAALEQQALQAQMNPHFIFNCLNGIQQYILTGNKEKANEYLTGFARLIRQTFDNSGQKAISIASEIKYLTEYLEMEKMRAAGSFVYTITAGADTDTGNTEIPAMLLQPYIENALRHGIRYKTNGLGEVHVSFVKQQQMLVCTVTDNGVGRVAAAGLKGTQHIEYQSKGMNLTERRINLLNKINDTKITVQVKDLHDYNNKPCGTEVVIQIPVTE